MERNGPYRYWASPAIDRDWRRALGAEFEGTSELLAELKIVDQFQPPGASHAVLVLADDLPPTRGISADLAVLPALATPEVLRTVGRLLVQQLRWRQAALTDPLTGLPNRRVWDAALRSVTELLGQYAVALLDFDQFKRVNETQGYAAGDQVLAAVGRRWSGALQPGWLLARIGGDEFGLLLPADQVAAVEELRKAVSIAAPGLTASAGYALATENTPEGLAAAFAGADAALRRGKQQGGNQTSGP